MEWVNRPDRETFDKVIGVLAQLVVDLDMLVDLGTIPSADELGTWKQKRARLVHFIRWLDQHRNRTGMSNKENPK